MLHSRHYFDMYHFKKSFWTVNYMYNNNYIVKDILFRLVLKLKVNAIIGNDIFKLTL